MNVPALSSRWPRNTFASAYNQRSNNFDFIRFVLASIVIWSHCYPLSGHGMDWFFAGSGQIDGASLAVDGFFVLSGFLVTQSWFGSPDPFIYGRKRFLRIAPGLAVALAFGAVVIGPLATTKPVWDYFWSGTPWLQFLGVFFNRYLFSPDFFTHNPLPTALNGSLWTLRYEILCYLTVPLLFMNRIRTLRIGIAATFVVSWLCYFAMWGWHSNPGFSTAAMAPRLFTCFCGGALFWTLRESVPYNFGVAFGAAFILVITFLFGGLRVMFPIVGAYLLFYIAFSRRVPFQRFGRYGDFSYGLYVFAYPIQQTVVQFCGTALSVPTYFAITFTATLAMAIASWHLVEAPALALKYRSARIRLPARLGGGWKKRTITVPTSR